MAGAIRREQSTPFVEACSKCLFDFPLLDTMTKLARSAGSSPVSIITLPCKTRSGARIGAPARTKRIEHTAARTNLLVRTKDQIDDDPLSGGIASGSIARANRRMVASR